MSAASAWSYTRTATHWPVTGMDSWTGATTYGAPVTFSCDYKGESKRMTDSLGQEFVSSLQIFTERDSVQPGDMVKLGASTEANPVTAGASKVRAVKRYSDIFDQLADDFEIAT